MRTKFLYYSLVLMLVLQNGINRVAALGDPELPSREASNEAENTVLVSDLRVNLSTATGKSIVFKPQDRETEVKANSTRNEIP